MERLFPLLSEKASFFAQSAFPRPHLHGAGRRGKRLARPYLFWYVYLHGTLPHLRMVFLLVRLVINQLVLEKDHDGIIGCGLAEQSINKPIVFRCAY